MKQSEMEHVMLFKRIGGNAHDLIVGVALFVLHFLGVKRKKKSMTTDSLTGVKIENKSEIGKSCCALIRSKDPARRCGCFSANLQNGKSREL